AGAIAGRPRLREVPCRGVRAAGRGDARPEPSPPLYAGFTGFAGLRHRGFTPVCRNLVDGSASTGRAPVLVDLAFVIGGLAGFGLLGLAVVVAERL
ncbi:hypothetical protein, partial [Rhodoplanes elegans]|uniref:hypothetical protein n=1 Tax=Rhodoplanes elegans TaxID=29408 RepID=UPI001A9208AF